jgi:hypothetical protein
LAEVARVLRPGGVFGATQFRHETASPGCASVGRAIRGARSARLRPRQARSPPTSSRGAPGASQPAARQQVTLPPRRPAGERLVVAQGHEAAGLGCSRRQRRTARHSPARPQLELRPAGRPWSPHGGAHARGPCPPPSTRPGRLTSLQRSRSAHGRGGRDHRPRSRSPGPRSRLAHCDFYGFYGPAWPAVTTLREPDRERRS